MNAHDQLFRCCVVRQVTLGWLTWPVQSVPAFGGIDVHNIPSIFVDGCKCTIGIATPGRPYCDWRNSVLFFVYCTIDYSYYAIGLYVIQTRGASLMILATAIVLQAHHVCVAYSLFAAHCCLRSLQDIIVCVRRHVCLILHRCLVFVSATLELHSMSELPMPSVVMCIFL